MKTGRVHGYVDRRLADMPVHGRLVVVRVWARRMRCCTVECSRLTFPEPLIVAGQLLHEITELGYTGNQNLLYRYITQGRVESRPAISPKRLTHYR